MKFGVVKPSEEEVRFVDLPSFKEAKKFAGLDLVDFGSLAPGVGICVYEFGLMEPGHSYFSVRGQLFAGTAIVFGVDEGGETVSLDEDDVPPVTFYSSPEKVEEAIAAKRVLRPEVSVNGTPFWRWNQPDVK